MNKLFAYSLFFFSLFSLAQENKMSYKFSYYSILNYKDYSNNLDCKMVYLINEKDSTYTLNLNYNAKEAILSDKKNKSLIKFDFDFNFEKIEDLNKLKNVKLYTEVHRYSRRKYKKFVEDFEFENDTTNKNVIVHITSFKNKKRKKIINEHYYFFGDNSKTFDFTKKSIKNYIMDKYHLNTIKDLNIIKILHLKKGKIESQTDFIEINNVNFNFIFNIEEVYPKRS